MLVTFADFPTIDSANDPEEDQQLANGKDAPRVPRNPSDSEPKTEGKTPLCTYQDVGFSFARSFFRHFVRAVGKTMLDPMAPDALECSYR